MCIFSCLIDYCGSGPWPGFTTQFPLPSTNGTLLLSVGPGPYISVVQRRAFGGPS